jgi:hypothetical protein
VPRNTEVWDFFFLNLQYKKDFMEAATFEQSFEGHSRLEHAQAEQAELGKRPPREIHSS